jgi:protein tyrosine phosphatase (PTP) superfamily phosphohydrolase (DUF442 family)
MHDGGPPRNFRWVAGGRLAGSARPDRPEQIAWLAAEGIGGVVSAVPLSGEVQAAMDEAGLEHLFVPIDEDSCAPSDAQIESFLRFADRMQSAGSAVLVHCVAGQIRTGALAALWLVHSGRSASEAIDKAGVDNRLLRELIQRWEDRRLGGS